MQKPLPSTRMAGRTPASGPAEQPAPEKTVSILWHSKLQTVVWVMGVGALRAAVGLAGMEETKGPTLHHPTPFRVSGSIETTP